MSYTLNQVEKFALSETRRWTITLRVREHCRIPVGVHFDSWCAAIMLTGMNESDRNELLDGATPDEFALYCRIESQRVAIREQENKLRTGKSHDVALLAVLRADFKSFLKEVEF